jgi:hypothetical protein
MRMIDVLCDLNRVRILLVEYPKCYLASADTLSVSIRSYPHSDLIILQLFGFSPCLNVRGCGTERNEERC